MTHEEVLADLDQTFEAHVAADGARMEAEGMGADLVAAVINENRRRYSECREQAAAWVLAANDCGGLPTMIPEGRA
jgi:hypothetical protein